MLLGRTRVLITTFEMSSAKTLGHGFAIWNCPDEGVVTPGEVFGKQRKITVVVVAPETRLMIAAAVLQRLEIIHSHKETPPSGRYLGTWIQMLDLTLFYYWTLDFISYHPNEARLNIWPAVYLILDI